MRSILLSATLVLAGTATAQQVTHGPCSPSIGSVGGNAIVNICPGERFASAQEALLVAAHPTTVGISDLRFESWFEDNLAQFLTVVLTNKSDVPAIGVSVDVMDLNSGAKYSALRPLRVAESGVFKRIGTKEVSLAAGASGDYPLFAVKDLLKTVHPEVPRGFCPYDASVSLIDRNEMGRARLESMADARVASQASDADSNGFVIKPSKPTQEVGTLLRMKYRTIFDQRVTSYATVFIDYADTRFEGDVWYPSQKKFGALRCIDRQRDGIGFEIR